MSGFVLIHRQILEDTAFRSDAEAMAFAWMVLRASWKPTQVRYKDRSISLNRGDLAMSVRDMAERLDRSKDWAKRFLDRLTNRDMIKITTATGVNIITICNYEKYQAEIEGAATGPIQRLRQDRDRTATQNNEGNKGTRDIEPNGPISQRGRVNDFPKLDFVSEQLWADFLKNRKTKKLTNTATAHKRVLSDLAKVCDETGWPPGQIFEACVAKGWGAIFNPIQNQGFSNGTGFNTNRPEPELNTVAQAVFTRIAKRAGREQELF
jgi:hypothetical protein